MNYFQLGIFKGQELLERKFFLHRNPEHNLASVRPKVRLFAEETCPTKNEYDIAEVFAGIMFMFAIWNEIDFEKIQ